MTTPSIWDHIPDDPRIRALIAERNLATSMAEIERINVRLRELWPDEPSSVVFTVYGGSY